MTAFTDREVPSDALKALFVAYTGSGQPIEQVYTYVPKITVLGLSSPNLLIISDGTDQDMKSANTNPTDFLFIFSVWIIARRDSDNYTNEQAETQLNALDKLIRQVIRDNTVIVNKWDDIQFEGRSRIDRIVREGTAFLIETRSIRVHLANGQV
jgi:hypothetical protein